MTTEDYKDSIAKKYGFPTTIGGSTRTESFADGLEFVAA